MIDQQYKIVPYTPDLLLEVVDLLKYLLGNNFDSNLAYFKWKHHDNPYLKDPLGIVALYNKEIVGFRGYFATKWCFDNKEQLILCPGDTCVHPDHQRKGLSLAMGYEAMREYTSGYRIFLNLSSNIKSSPGYLKMGFVPLAPKRYFQIFKKRSLINGIRFIMGSKKKSDLTHEAIPLGKFDDIIISRTPESNEMNEVIVNQDCVKIRLLQDQDFFRWRFKNVRKEYIFYYYKPLDSITGYLVVEVSGDRIRNGNILDYGESDGKAIEKILKYIISSEHFQALTIQNFWANDSLIRIFQRLGFNQHSAQHVSSEPPFLIRPVKEKFNEEDWVIEGMDIRDANNWEIKPICSDAA